MNNPAANENVRQLPFTLSFSAGKISTAEIAEDMNRNNGTFHLDKTAGKKGKLYIGETYLGPVCMNEDASKIEITGGYDENLTTLIGSSGIRLDVRLAKCWIKPSENTFRDGTLIRLDTGTATEAELVYSGTNQSIAAGEVVLVDNFFGLRIQRMEEQRHPSPGDRGFIEAEVILGRLDLSPEMLNQLGEGSVLQLDTPFNKTMELISNGSAIARGSICARQNASTELDQTYTKMMDAGTPGLYFRVSSTEPRKNVAETAAEDTAAGLSLASVLRAVSSQNLSGYLASAPRSVRVFLLKYLASLVPEKAAPILNSLIVDEKGVLEVDFIRCNPGRAAAHLSGILGAELLKLCSDSEKQGIDTVGDVFQWPDDYKPARAAAECLLQLDLRTREEFLARAENIDAEAANEAASFLFFPSDLLLLENRALQVLLREIDTKDIVILLSRAEDELKQKILNNTSKRMQILLKEELDAGKKINDELYYSTVSNICNILRRLEDSGEIII